jgi:hypothetical protein
LDRPQRTQTIPRRLKARVVDVRHDRQRHKNRTLNRIDAIGEKPTPTSYTELGIAFGRFSERLLLYYSGLIVATLGNLAPNLNDLGAPLRSAEMRLKTGELLLPSSTSPPNRVARPRSSPHRNRREPHGFQLPFVDQRRRLPYAMFDALGAVRMRRDDVTDGDLKRRRPHPHFDESVCWDAPELPLVVCLCRFTAKPVPEKFVFAKAVTWTARTLHPVRIVRFKLHLTGFDACDAIRRFKRCD